jgi:hypothetical protein
LLSSNQSKAYYARFSLQVPAFWRLSRKHFRVVLADGRFVKLNKFENARATLTARTHGKVIAREYWRKSFNHYHGELELRKR